MGSYRGLLYRIVITIIILSFNSIAISAGLLEFGNVKISPKLSAGETYSDNIFLSDKNKEEDYINEFSADIPADIAITPENIFSLRYKGVFKSSNNFDNFKEDEHTGELSWFLVAPAGSSINVSAETLDSSIQPYSEQGRHKSYIRNEFSTNINLMVWDLSEFDIKYIYRSREFDSKIDEIDNYDFNSINLQYVNSFFYQFPLLLECRFSTTDNTDPSGSLSTDSKSYSVLIGGRWKPETQLSGTLRVGWLKEDFEELQNYQGVAIDTDLSYRLTEITRLQLTANRDVKRSTRAERETKNYYISTFGGISSISNFSDTLYLTLFYEYKKNNYKGVDREDKKYQTGLRLKYSLGKTLSFFSTYRHRRTDSTLSTVEYKENRIKIGISLYI
jgi:hypothetical protein